MRVIIAGSRTINDYGTVRAAVEASGFHVTTVVSGGARGVDLLGERWARERGISVLRFDANWEKHGRRAGILRNEQMVRESDALVAVWDGASRGTRHVIEFAIENGLKAYVHRIDREKGVSDGQLAFDLA
jgi:hypothetical protein